MTEERFRHLLLEKGLLDRDGLEQAEAFARAQRFGLPRAVVELGLASEAEAWKLLAAASSLPFVDPSKAKIADSVLARIPAEQALEKRALPCVERNGVLYVAVEDPDRTWVLDELALFSELPLKPALAPPSALATALQEAYGAEPRGNETRESPAAAADGDDDAPVVRLVHRILEEALAKRASDVHVEPYESHVRIRYRIDGVLHDAAKHPRALLGPLTSRLKIMASLDIAEKRKPQDGRIQFRVQGRDIDIRTSVLPSNHGETLVMRLLDKERGLISLEALGFAGQDFERFQRIIKRPNGIFLVTGPTGSGKTTTLYAALRALNRPDVKIITAEDPVEYNISGINQVQVHHAIGLDFARILRAMLRQAPNIILVGEIRDSETAEVAIQAALTGHLVFSTLHTNDAPSALARLIDMGVKPFLVAASVQAILAQRLVRLLCPSCKEAYEPGPVELRALGLAEEATRGRPFYRPKGCEACSGSGYLGRKGIFELLEMDDELREMTFRRRSSLHLREYAIRSGNMSPLRADGARKVLEGLTSVEEVLRVVAARAEEG